jgi:hypothetical protein
MAAGTFLIYNNEPVGWVFVAISSAMCITGIVWLIRFQNKFRARGILKHGTAAEVIEEEIDVEQNLVDFRPPADSESIAANVLPVAERQ